MPESGYWYSTIRMEPSDTTINGIRGDVGAMRGGVMLAETGGRRFSCRATGWQSFRLAQDTARR